MLPPRGLIPCVKLCKSGDELKEDHETDHSGDGFVPYEEPLAKMAQDRGVDIELKQAPVPDTGAPSKDHMISILNTIDEAVNRGLPVYVHCWGGVGRTGTVVGCYLARHAVANGSAVIDRIKVLRRNDPTAHRSSPERGPQEHTAVQWGLGQ